MREGDSCVRDGITLDRVGAKVGVYPWLGPRIKNDTRAGSPETEVGVGAGKGGAKSQEAREGVIGGPTQRRPQGARQC